VTINVALYARYSSETQREASIEDQCESARDWEKRGQVSVELGGDLAAFLYLSEPAEDGTSDSRTAVAQGGNGRSGGSMGTLVAGTRNQLDLLLTG
jgi:hypothetical protein